jgi:5,6-dimethylbenzimidazole synthase
MSDFTREQIDALYRILAAGRDMRHFRSDPIDEALLGRLLGAAHLAPSVGFMQPWRFIRVREAALRASICALVEAERLAPGRAAWRAWGRVYALESAGYPRMRRGACGRACRWHEKHVFGRRTMPEMNLASAACVIQNMWLAARAEDIGMGWVSLFDPKAMRALLRMPEGSQPVAVLCLGHVDAFYPQPMLEMERWAQRADLRKLVFTDYWGAGPT